MASRRQTPDVLGEILGGEPAAPPPAPKQPAKRRPSTREASRRSRAAQPRWEYMEIIYRDYGGYRARFVNGQEQRDWKGMPVIYEHLNELGEAGWELVGVGGRHNDEMPAYFRRRKK